MVATALLQQVLSEQLPQRQVVLSQSSIICGLALRTDLATSVVQRVWRSVGAVVLIYYQQCSYTTDVAMTQLCHDTIASTKLVFRSTGNLQRMVVVKRSPGAATASVAAGCVFEQCSAANKLSSWSCMSWSSSYRSCANRAEVFQGSVLLGAAGCRAAALSGPGCGAAAPSITATVQALRV